MFGTLNKLVKQMPDDEDKLMRYENWALWEDQATNNTGFAKKGVGEEIFKLLKSLQTEDGKPLSAINFSYDGAL